MLIPSGRYSMRLACARRKDDGMAPSNGSTRRIGLGALVLVLTGNAHTAIPLLKR